MLLVLAAGLAACRPQPFPLPDPDEEFPPVSCEEDVLLGLTRTSANSTLDQPTWLQVCTLCPIDSLSMTLVDETETVITTHSAWAEAGHCALSMPTGPLPQESPVSVLVQLRDSERSADWSFEAAAHPDPTTPPLELGSGTYLAEGGVNNLSLPSLSGELDPQLLELITPEILVGISPPDKSGKRAIRIGQGEGGAQDLCSLTSELSEDGVSEAGEVWGALAQGTEFPGLLGGPVRRGSLRAQLSEDGSSLNELAILAVIDLEVMAPVTGVDAGQACAQWLQQLGSDPCVPCGEPGEGAVGPAHCITTLFEWTSAPRAEYRLEPVSSESISTDCPTP